MEPLEYRGQYAACKVFTEALDPNTVQQIYGFLNSPAFEGAAIRIMPDVHAGKGAVIGFTAPLGDKVIPNVIGVDIGCGVSAIPLTGVSKGEIDFPTFDEHLRATIPAGFKVRSTRSTWLGTLFKKHVSPRFPTWDAFEEQVNVLAAKVGDDPHRTWLSCGTLGGGNHFIEIGRDEETHDLWLVVHSGSRHFGLAIAEYHQKKATSVMGPKGGLAWLEGADAEEYLQDMRTAQLFAALNRVVMLDGLAAYYAPMTQIVTSVHNFIGDDNVIRKGAISAREGEKVIIPWNMRDGMILGVGKGNAEWNNSAPHGAGRKMGRGEAKRKLSLDDFTETMKKAKVWTSCVGRDTLDEAPGAYKPVEDIIAFLGETVEVTAKLQPVYNFKASGE